MSEALFVAASVFIPLVFGLVPAFLPTSIAAGPRWILWLAILALTGWYVRTLSDAPSPYQLMALIFLVVSACLSFIVLVVETSRAPRPRSAARS